MRASHLRSSDLWSGIIFIGVGLVFFTQSFSYKTGSALNMGPGYFPLLLSSLLLGIGVMIIFASFRTANTIETTNLKTALPVLLAAVFFGTALETLGFVLSTAGTMLIASFSGQDTFKRTLLMIFVCTILATLGVFALRLPYSLLPNMY